jgi:hypothetical protein
MYSNYFSSYNSLLKTCHWLTYITSVLLFDTTIITERQKSNMYMYILEFHRALDIRLFVDNSYQQSTYSAVIRPFWGILKYRSWTKKFSTSLGSKNSTSTKCPSQPPTYFKIVPSVFQHQMCPNVESSWTRIELSEMDIGLF